MKFLAHLCALALLTSFVFAADPPKGERIFITSHSFHAFVAGKLPVMANAAGIKDQVIVGHQSIGGSKTLQHWNLPLESELPASPAPVAQTAAAAPGATPAPVKKPQVNIAKPALMTGGVDVFTMAPHMTYMPDEGIDHFVELGLQHNPKMRFMVQESWPIFDGWLPDEKIVKNEDRDARSLDIVRTASKRFRDACEAQAAAINKKVGHDVVFVVPAGAAIMKLRELVAEGKVPGFTKQSDLFNDPIGHGKDPIQTLAAYCNFACIYHMSPVGLQDTNPTLDQISPELRPLLQKIAWETVSTYPPAGLGAAKVAAATN